MRSWQRGFLHMYVQVCTIHIRFQGERECVCVCVAIVKISKIPPPKKVPSKQRLFYAVYPYNLSPVVDVNLHNFHFSTQTSSKTRRLGDSGAVGLGWCVPTTAVKAHVLPSKFAFRSFASHKARSRGRRGYAPQASFFYQFELFSGSLSPSGLGSRPVPQELRFKLI